MQPIFLDDPAWRMTFPHRVTPEPGEALVSLLLRCDEENHWASGITCAHLGAVVHASTKLPNLIVPTSSLVATVASLLSRAPSTIAATTYLWELSRIFETTTPEPGYLCPWFTFRVCPACIKEQHVLLRDHFLLGVTACQQHQLFLQSSCACGTALQPFDPSSSLFTCFQCEQAWGQLPHVQASAEDLEKEHAILACYCWWLRYADQAYLKDTLQLLMYLDVFSSGRKNRTPQRSPRWFDGLPRARFHLRPSCLGSLSWLVQDLDEKGLLARYEASKLKLFRLDLF